MEETEGEEQRLNEVIATGNIVCCMNMNMKWRAGEETSVKRMGRQTIACCRGNSAEKEIERKKRAERTRDMKKENARYQKVKRKIQIPERTNLS